MSLSTKQAVRTAAVALIAASLAGCSLLPKEEGALNPPLVKPAQENYRTVAVEKGTIEKRISGVGYLESVSSDMAQFTAQGGRIDEILVSSGQKVKKGDVLVRLVMEGLDLQMKEQEVALERAKLARKQASGGDADVRRIADLQLEIERMKYERLAQQAENRILRSGIDGQVIFVEDLDKGDFVEPYRTLVTVADPAKLRVTLRVDNSNDIREAEIGMNAEIKLGDDKLKGKVVQTPSSAPQTLNQELAERYSKTLYIDSDALTGYEIGESVDVAIVTQRRENVLKIPRSSLRSYLGRSFVRILEEGNRIREADVEQGLASATEIEIVQGVEEGQQVILQ